MKLPGLASPTGAGRIVDPGDLGSSHKIICSNNGTHSAIANERRSHALFIDTGFCRRNIHWRRCWSALSYHYCGFSASPLTARVNHDVRARNQFVLLCSHGPKLPSIPHKTAATGAYGKKPLFLQRPAEAAVSLVIEDLREGLFTDVSRHEVG